MTAAKLFHIIPIAALLAVAGCTALRPYEYNVLCRNRSGLNLTDFRISYGNFTTQFGSYLRVTEPLPAVAHVQFCTQGGETHDRQVPIPEEIRRSVRSSDLMFLIEPDLSVTVLLRTPEQRRAEAGTL